jgi:hypothetical protein
LYRFKFSARQAKRSFFSGKLGDTVALSGSNILSRLNISPRESAAHTHTHMRFDFETQLEEIKSF